MIHCLVSIPGRTLLPVQIMTFFPRKSEKEKRGNTRWLDTQLERQVTYVLGDSWSLSSSIDVSLKFILSAEQHARMHRRVLVC